MGYLREKYTKEYFLNRDINGKKTDYGVAGIEDFMRGNIRETDKEILSKIDFYGKRVIDFGFGRGEAIKYAYEKSAKKICGVDFSRDSFLIASNFLKKNKIKAELYCDDALKFIKQKKEAGGKKYDIAIMLDFVEHVPRNELLEILILLKELLTEKAVLVINTPFFKIDNDVLKEGLRQEAYDESDKFPQTQGMHCNRYTYHSLIDFMEKAGYFSVSGHYFLNNPIKIKKEEKENVVWSRAIKNSYPLQGSWRKDAYEFVSTENAKPMNSHFNNKDYELSDYNHSNLVDINFGKFGMFSTKRLAEFYIPGKFEKFTSELIENFLKKDDVFVDIGAHYGYYSLLASQKLKEGGEVFAFEPVIENCDLIRKNIKRNSISNITLINSAVSNSSGSKIFNVSEASDSSAFHRHPLAKSLEIRKIKTYSLDDYFKNKKIDIAKIDTEGHELHVLGGMKRVISENKELKLFIEFNPKCLMSAGTNPDSLLDYLSSCDFEIYFIDDENKKLFRYEKNLFPWQDLLMNKEYMNILCLKKENSLFVSFISHSAETAGAEKALLNIMEELNKKGVLVQVFFPKIGPFLDHIKNKTIISDICSYSWWTKDYWRMISSREKKRKVECEIQQMASILERMNPHIIFTNTSVIYQGAILSRIFNKPHIWRISEFGTKEHGIDYFLPLKERGRFMDENSEKIVFISHALKNYYSCEIPKEKSEIIYDFISSEEVIPIKKDRKRYFKQGDSLKILVLGSIQPGKKQKEAVESVHEIIKNNKKNKIELILVGSNRSGDYFREITEYISKNELKNSVFILDFLNKPYEIIQEADIVLSCSRDEGLGMVMVEALHQGKALIGARSGATTEVIYDNKNGFLYDPGNIKDLSSKIEIFLNKRELIEKFGKESENISIDKFNKNNLVNKLLKISFDLKNKGCYNSTPNFYNSLINNILIKRFLKIKQLESEVIYKNNIISKKEKNIIVLKESLSKKNEELEMIKSSKFWKIRERYILFKNKITRKK